MVHFLRLERLMFVASSLVLLAFVGCERTDVQQPAANSPTATASESTSPDVRLLSGRYLLQGVTVQASDGRSRPLSGTMELRVSGEEYTARFSTKTVLPGEIVPVPASVEGEGMGFVRGRSMVGSTTSRMRLDRGEDEGTPGSGTAEELRVISTALSEVAEDGSIVIRLQNEPAEGNDYSPSVSILNAHRIGDLIDVAGGPPSR
ncbi:MAG: hypothetical protein JRE70_19735 [Deltaproteobacteria bacterium]|nr:hypothetical protein [Deltaproteobacteria bacterium]